MSDQFEKNIQVGLYLILILGAISCIVFSHITGSSMTYDPFATASDMRYPE